MEGGKTKKKPSPISLQQFVSIMAPLIDLEKEAEISASITSGASRSLDTAQKKGSTILNLKCVDAQVLRQDNSALANDIWKEMKALSVKLLKTKDKNTRRDIQKELRALSKEEHKRQQLAVADVIKNADVVLTTLTGALSHKLENTSFDLVIIDEAAQVLEIACWIALLKGSRCILAGDHLQLPPTIQSVEAGRKGLGRTLFECLADLYGDEVTSMLTVQYRMHELIMNWSSEKLYNSKIKAHPSVAAHMLFDLEDVKRSSSTEPALLLVDIAG